MYANSIRPKNLRVTPCYAAFHMTCAIFQVQEFQMDTRLPIWYCFFRRTGGGIWRRLRKTMHARRAHVLYQQPAAFRCTERNADGRQAQGFYGTRVGGTFVGENNEREPQRRLSVETSGVCEEERRNERGEKRAAPPGRRRDSSSVHVRLLFERGCRGFGPCRRGCR